MQVENMVRAIAGAMVTLSLLLGAAASPIFVSTHFLWLTLFVGVNLFQSSFTGFCPLEMMLKRMKEQS